MDVLQPEAGRHRKAPEQEAALEEPGVGLVLPLVVLDQDPVARAGRVAVLLPALLVLEVRAQAEVGLQAEAEETVAEAYPRLHAPVHVAAQPSLVPARGVEVGHARAARVARVVGPLARVARLPPPVPPEVRAVDLGGDERARAGGPGVPRGGAVAVAVEEVVVERVLARVRFPL